jgi:hypothetical protein
MGHWKVLILAALAAAACCFTVVPMRAQQGQGAAASAVGPTELSAQSRAPSRRARTRIEIYPLPGPLRRECVAAFQERWIPQWGGWVLYPGQRCWWTRAPA